LKELNERYEKLTRTLNGGTRAQWLVGGGLIVLIFAILIYVVAQSIEANMCSVNLRDRMN
jgi:hypothetical protein